MTASGLCFLPDICLAPWLCLQVWGWNVPSRLALFCFYIIWNGCLKCLSRSEGSCHQDVGVCFLTFSVQVQSGPNDAMETIGPSVLTSYGWGWMERESVVYSVPKCTLYIYINIYIKSPSRWENARYLGLVPPSWPFCGFTWLSDVSEGVVPPFCSSLLLLDFQKAIDRNRVVLICFCLINPRDS